MSEELDTEAVSPAPESLTAEIPPDKDFSARYEGRPVNVHRSDGTLEGNWSYAKLDILPSGQLVTVSKEVNGVRIEKTVPREVFEAWNNPAEAPAEPDAAMEFDWGDDVAEPATPPEPAPDWREQLTPEQRAVQARRDQWQEINPGQSIYSPEGKTVGPEDIARLEAEAASYDFDNYDRKNIAEIYEAVRQAGGERAEKLREKYEADGENYGSDTKQQLIAKKAAEAVEAKRAELIKAFHPDPPEGASRKETKQVTQKRQKLAALLSKSPDEFAALQTDWQAYEDISHTRELDRQHNLALEDDKSLRIREEKTRLKQEISELNARNGGALEELSQLPLAGDARVAELMRSFKEATARHGSDEDLLDADKLQAFHDMKWRLGELLAAPDGRGKRLSDAEIAARTEELAPALEDWLEAGAGADSDPLADLKLYEQKKTAYELWDRRRRQAAEYLGPVLILNSVRRMLGHRQEAKAEARSNAGETVKLLLDPQGIGENNGAHALRKAGELTDEDADIYKAGIIGQLETARNLSRHQGNVLKAALMVNALTIGSFESLSAGFDYLPGTEKMAAWKKSSLGKLGTGLALGKKIATPKRRWFQSEESFKKDQAKAAAAAAKEAA